MTSAMRQKETVQPTNIGSIKLKKKNLTIQGIINTVQRVINNNTQRETTPATIREIIFISDKQTNSTKENNDVLKVT